MWCIIGKKGLAVWFRRLLRGCGGIAGVAVSVSLLGSIATAQVLEPSGPGHIDWTDQYIEATGSASFWEYTAENATAPPSEVILRRGAAMHARQQLLRSLEHLRVDSEHQLRDLWIANKGLRQAVYGLTHSPEVETDVGVDIEQTVRLAFLGRLLEVLGSSQSRWDSADAPVQPGAGNAKQPYTGVIVDAREVALQPALFPQVYGEQGDVLYGPGRVQAQAARQEGMAVYVRSMAAALEHSRVGRRPEVLKAFSVQGKLATDAVVLAPSKDMAQLVPALQHARVVFVLGQQNEGIEENATSDGPRTQIPQKTDSSEVEEFELR
ncbi:MAG: hypothetical protein ACQESV_02005 [Thermodesulfobacteriota bacterium]